MRIVAVIPAKGTSRRLPCKNMATFGHSTLIGHKVDQLLECSLIDAVVVGSDDQNILCEARAHGAIAIERDAYHCDESKCSANGMIRDLIRRVDAQVGADVIVWAHCTNPLVTSEIYQAAITAFLDRPHTYDSLCSVSMIRRHAWWNGSPLNFDPQSVTHQPAANLQPLYLQDGAIFIQPSKQMLVNSYFYGSAPMLFPVEWPHGIDIDTQADLDAARRIFGVQERAITTFPLWTDVLDQFAHLSEPPATAIRRIVDRQCRIAGLQPPADVSEVSMRVALDLWSHKDLAGLHEQMAACGSPSINDTSPPRRDDLPITVLRLCGQYVLLDGAHRINKWMHEPGTYPVLVIQPKREAA